MTLARATASTDTGQRRRRNEDSFVCEPPLFAVADGMGGAQAGEIASQLAATSLRSADRDVPSGEERVVALIQDANRSVYERAHTDESASGMGTTMTVALVDGDVVRIGHVGDSRAYLVRGHRLEQLTEDHSLVAELMRSGRLSPEEAQAHPHRSVITRVLGTDPEVDVDAFSVATRPADLFMICSDGLTSMVDDAKILELLEHHRPDLKAAAAALIQEANANGGEDNVTVVLFEIASLDDTIEFPAALVETEEQATRDVDEDTLGDLTRIRPIPSTVPPTDPKQSSATRRRKVSTRVWVAVAAVLVALAVGLGVFGLSRANFIGADDDGYVAVYQGVPWSLPFGIHLYREVWVSRLLAVQLSSDERKRLFDHSLVDRGAAEGRVKELEQDVVP